jgi:hypothetical protein
MRTRSLILFMVLITLTGCIVMTYRDFPNATLESLPKNHEPNPLYYHVEPIITQTTTADDVSLFIAPGFYTAFPQLDPIGHLGITRWPVHCKPVGCSLI